jgi:hypothetical protein
MSGSSIKFDLSALVSGVEGLQSKADAAIQMYAETGALKMQNYARSNARWQNRTGQARQRLTGTSMKYANGYKIQLAHGVDYGKWLELANEKRYSIIPETIQNVGKNEIMPGFSSLLSKLGGG